MDSMFEQIELVAIKMLFEAMIKQTENDFKKKAEELGLDIDIEIKCEVKGVNLDTFHEKMQKDIKGGYRDGRQ